MAHPQQLCFMDVTSKHLAVNGYTGKHILEIGSYDVNGSIRSLFQNSHYTGIDLITGPGVDLVCAGDKASFPDESYDITISCECFEHNPQWLETFLNMYRMTKSGGIVIFTCATTGRIEHGTSRTNPSHSPGTQGVGWDYYRNLRESDFRGNFSFESQFDSHLFLKNHRANDLYFVGQKKGDNKMFQFSTLEILTLYTNASRELERSINKNHPYPKFLRALAYCTLLPVRIASLLPETYFQNFSVYYCKVDNLVKAWALKMLFGKKPRDPAK